MSLLEEALLLQRAAHDLMYLGMDGSPIYSDDLSPASLLKLRLLTACYGEVFDEPLADEAHSIIASWNAALLTAEQQEAVDEFQNVMENPYPWEEVKD